MWGGQILPLYECVYQSPLGKISLVATDVALIGAWFEGQRYFQAGIKVQPIWQEQHALLKRACLWLDAYFERKLYPMLDCLSPQGTDFQRAVWRELQTIRWGETLSYGELAKRLQCRSAQAVGGAIGRNPLSIFIPCHRVLAADGRLIGYAGGLEKKAWLLRHEQISVNKE
ncbi:methylated-DNA--[protein]-cysteine S-methyltransferase [Streptococcus equi]|uniref:methylated-DNA--[protein]-cysteine S-methyltransferase n=1 Tax=Streptococcus equi TaxID=1336 RepID=UPI0005BCBA98|nr:methylated-DNA--[protein]-cysteine S-methyltransferase [Streptococcus equi]KIS09192.1 methylated-DNA--protein-cysteine methyltransferase [Streptococcus equi subsp. zooepidemicus Sz5]